jgi:hypothetical protein
MYVTITASTRVPHRLRVDDRLPRAPFALFSLPARLGAGTVLSFV